MRSTRSLAGQMLWNRMRTLAHRAAESRRAALHRRPPSASRRRSPPHISRSSGGRCCDHRPAALRRTPSSAYWDELQSVLASTRDRARARAWRWPRSSGCTISTSAPRPTWRASTRSPPSPSCARSWNRWSSRAYSEIHETRAPVKVRWKACVLAFPRAFRRHLGAFRLSLAVTLLGCAFGWFAIRVGPARQGRPDALRRA